jgi:hypothetical protein
MADHTPTTVEAAPPPPAPPKERPPFKAERPPVKTERPPFKAERPPVKVPPPTIGAEETLATEKKKETAAAKEAAKKAEAKVDNRELLPPPVDVGKSVAEAEKVEIAPPTADSTPGQLAWRPPRTMTVGKTELVEARLSADTSAALTEGLKGSGPIETHDLQITPHMRVRLDATAKGDFEIAPLNCPNPSNCEDQRILPREINTWTWSVTPLRSGNLSLILTASMLFGEEAHALPSLQETITVGVSSPGYYIGRFVSANWQWLWAAILVPVGGWILARRKPKR